MKKLIFMMVLAGAAFSCKDGNKDDKQAGTDTPAVQEVEVKENFSVEIDAEASKTDDFALYYTEDGTNQFVEAQVAWRGISAGKEEKVTFELSPEIAPTNIRLDFGLNKQQDHVVIKNVRMSYYGNVIEFKGSEFFKYFIKDNQFNAEINAEEGTLTISKSGDAYKTPYYYPTQDLLDALRNLTNT